MLNTRLSKILPLSIIYFAITCLFLVALFIAIWFSKSSYSSLVDYITGTLKRPDLKSLITKSLFTEEKYRVIYKFHWFIYPIITVFCLAFYFNANRIVRGLLHCKNHIRRSFSHVNYFFKNLTKKEKLLIVFGCCLYAVTVLYNNHLKPISYDEAWGFNYYINKPFYFPLILFNTYPLFNLVTHFFTFLPFDTLINIRLPSLLFGLLSILALFYTLYKKVGFLSSCLALILLAASPLFYIYSSLSRGITLSLFLSIAIFHVVLQLTTCTTFSSRYKFLYIVTNFLGIISMPTFFVYTVCNTTFLLYKKHKEKAFVKRVWSSTLIIFLLSAIFYLPVILSAGLSLFSHNNHYSFNIADTISKESSFITGLSNLFFGSKYIALFLVSISIVLLFLKPLNKTTRALIIYSLIILFFTLLIRAATGNIFPERSLNYLVISFIILAISIVSALLFYLNTPLTIVLIIFFIGLLSFSFINNQRELLSPPEDKDAKMVAVLLLKNNVASAYIDEEEFWLRTPMIQYYYLQAHKEISFSTSVKSSTRYKPFTESENYDCIITSTTTSNNINISYKEIFRTDSFVLWKRL